MQRRGWLLFILFVVLAVFLAWKHFPPQLTVLPVADPEAAKPERAQVYLGPANSIAVLPFGAGSMGGEQVFLPAGFAGELHQLLTRVPGLQVTSSNSSFFFQDSALSLAVMAQRLQVRRLLSGEVAVADGRVQITARLYDARREREIWSQTYEGAVDDVFGFQDDIIARTAKTIAPGNRGALPVAKPVNTQAWAARLEGVYQRNVRTPASFEAAEAAFLTALELEPGYATARVDLAGLWLGAGVAGGSPAAGRVEQAREALETALRTEPELPAALGLLSHIQRNIDWDWQAALETAARAVRLSPGDPELKSTASLALFSLGQFEKAGELLEDSVAQDPLNLGRRLQLGLLLEFSGRYDDALGRYRQIMSLNPDFPGARAYRARVKIIQDKPESALKESEQEVDPFWKQYSQILALSALGDDGQAQSLLDRFILDYSEGAAFQVAEILAFRGEIDRSFEWLQRAGEQKDGGMSEILGDWFLGNLHGDPRWEELLGRMGFSLDSNQ